MRVEPRPCWQVGEEACIASSDAERWCVVIQHELNFASADLRPVLVRYTKADREFFATTPLLDLPPSFLMESRAQRVGCSLSELRAMRSHELARELADEVAILGAGPLEKTCRIHATWIDQATIDAIANRMAAERAFEWQEFLRSKRGGGA